MYDFLASGAQNDLLDPENPTVHLAPPTNDRGRRQRAPKLGALLTLYLRTRRPPTLDHPPALGRRTPTAAPNGLPYTYPIPGPGSHGPRLSNGTFHETAGPLVPEMALPNPWFGISDQVLYEL
ncbi:hypothetical protein G7046_g9864 [Stylonectria norvegica]|nr:hypothetical protein G7046_g9864 [Stylonectria norvegica]